MLFGIILLHQIPARAITVPKRRSYRSSNRPLKLSVMMWGSPGVGKSQLVAELARRREAKLRDVRLSQKTASDIGGLPALDHQNKQTTFYLPDFLPREKEDN
jgi:hypothetical protein